MPAPPLVAPSEGPGAPLVPLRPSRPQGRGSPGQAKGSAAGDALPPRAFRLAPDPDPPHINNPGRSRGAAAQSPPSCCCHLPPGRAGGDCPAAFRRAGRVCRPARPGGLAPRSRKRAAGGGAAAPGRPCFPQARSALSRSLACLRLALGRGLLSFRLGRGLACPRLAPRPPPSSLQARSAAVPTSFQARSPPPHSSSSSQARSRAAAPQPPRLRRCSRGALLRFSSGSPQGRGAERSAAASPGRLPAFLRSPEPGGAQTWRGQLRTRPGTQSLPPPPPPSIVGTGNGLRLA